ncbi:MAG: rRNA maturation RNase YbeY [Gammaproteobacteria bacterium]|nr:rRNA maturation RNase YbeY [Gammaproteobacteria bacterium]
MQPKLTLQVQFARVPEVALARQLLSDKKIIRAWLKASFEREALITVRFVGLTEGATLNAQFRQKTYATNVLTFCYQDPPVWADIVVCPPIVEKEAEERNLSVLHHYAHLLVHGALHAQGWVHENNLAQERLMQLKEIEILSGFHIANPY